jgi:hypothetical protein
MRPDQTTGSAIIGTQFRHFFENASSSPEFLIE